MSAGAAALIIALLLCIKSSDGVLAFLQGSRRVVPHAHALYKRTQEVAVESSLHAAFELVLSLLLEVDKLESCDQRIMFQEPEDVGEGVQALEMLEKATTGSPVANPQRAFPHDMMDGLTGVPAQTVDGAVEVKAFAKISDRSVAGEESGEPSEKA